MTSNLPPGVSDDMLPGNRPEDITWESAIEQACDELCESDLTAEEVRRAVKIGIAAVKAEREDLKVEFEEIRKDERMVCEGEFADRVGKW